MNDNNAHGVLHAAQRLFDQDAARPGLSPVEVWRRLEHATGTPGFSPVAKAAAERAWMKILKATGAKA